MTPEMLRTGPYPLHLKERIRGDRGHLSNEMGGQFAAWAGSQGTRRVILAHLSQENNLPELALAAAEGIRGLRDTAVFSIGSDGTDGPTDAAGGYCDGSTKDRLLSKGIDLYQVLRDNNAYMALEEAGGLIKTGPTGTNVNDVAVLLIKRGDGDAAAEQIRA